MGREGIKTQTMTHVLDALVNDRRGYADRINRHQARIILAMRKHGVDERVIYEVCFDALLMARDDGD